MKQKAPFLITLFSIFLGVFIAILFAVNEDLFKKQIANGLLENAKVIEMSQSSAPEMQEKKASYIKAESEKNWRYYQRFHFHSTGIAAMSLGILLVISLLSAPKLQVLIASYMVAIGGFLYPFVWLFAGIYGPSMGRSAAKESFALFGYMGGVFLVGVAFSIYLVARYPLRDFLKNESLSL